MNRTASILKNTRQEKDYSIAQISQKIKVPLKYLAAIEAEDAANFPEEPYISLIVKDYAQFLGLDGQQMLRLFYRDFSTKINSSPDLRPKNPLSPQAFFSYFVIIATVVFSVYLLSEYFQFHRPPHLSVVWPATVSPSSASLEIRGTTDPEATVRINHNLVMVDTKGNFVKKISYDSRSPKITVTAQSPSGKTTIAEKNYQE
jgi:cytoskeletal protein RodZ